MIRRILLPLVALACLSLAACGEYGNVEQGRVVAFDKEKDIVTIIKDAGIDDRHPQYTVLPAHQFKMPADPGERGANPAVGLRMKLDVEKKVLVMYNPKKEAFDELPFEIVSLDENVSLRMRHPLVWDDATRKARPFPVVDAEKRTLTIFSPRQSLLATIKLAEDDFGRYGEKDWDAGDEVRIYYREPGVALRFMNVTRTDITRR